MSTEKLTDQMVDDLEQDWDTPLSLELTVGAIIDTVFVTASSVHSGTESCVDPQFVLAELTAHDQSSQNYCRLVELEYSEEHEPDIIWHDWTVELSIKGTFVIGHWRVQHTSGPADWSWSASEAESAFQQAAVLVGRRVRRGVVVDEPAYAPQVPQVRH